MFNRYLCQVFFYFSIFHFPHISAEYMRPAFPCVLPYVQKTSGTQNTTDSAPAFHPQTARAICGSRLCTEKNTDIHDRLHRPVWKPPQMLLLFQRFSSVQIHLSRFPVSTHPCNKNHTDTHFRLLLPQNNSYSSRSFHIPLPDILPPSVPDWKTYEYPSSPLRQNPHTTDQTARTEIFHTAPVPPHKCCAPESHPAV